MKQGTNSDLVFEISDAYIRKVAAKLAKSREEQPWRYGKATTRDVWDKAKRIIMKNKGKRVAKDGSLSEAAPGIESMGYGLPAHVAKLLAKKGLSHVFWLHKRMSGAPPQKGKRPANEARSPEEHMRAISRARDEELNRLRTAISKRTKDFKGHRKSIGDRQHRIRLKYQKRLRDRRASAQVVDSTEYEGPSLSEADFASALEKLKKKNPALARHRVRTTPYPSGLSRGKERHQQETPYTSKERAEVQSAIKYYRKNPVASGDTAEESRSKRKFPVKSSTEYEGPSLKEVTKKLIIKTGKGMIAQSRKEAEEEKKVPQTTPYGKGHAEGEHQAKSVWIGRRVKRLMGKLAVKQQRKGQSASLSEISSKYIQKAMKRDVKRTRRATKDAIKQHAWGRFPATQGLKGFAHGIAREFAGRKLQKPGTHPEDRQGILRRKAGVPSPAEVGARQERDIRARGAKLTDLNTRRRLARATGASQAQRATSAAAGAAAGAAEEVRKKKEAEEAKRKGTGWRGGGTVTKPDIFKTESRESHTTDWAQAFMNKKMKEQHNEAKEMDWGEAFKKHHMNKGARDARKKEKKKKLKLPKEKKPRPSVLRREEKSKTPKATQF